LNWYKHSQEEPKGKTLGDFATIKIGLEDADFWIIRRGSESKVGKPVNEFSKESIGVKVKDTDRINPKYLKYMIEYLWSQGYFKNLSHGTTELVNIKTKDVADIRLKFQ
jgi:hypothetical protein